MTVLTARFLTNIHDRHDWSTPRLGWLPICVYQTTLLRKLRGARR